jgi:hypothetical protein
MLQVMPVCALLQPGADAPIAATVGALDDVTPLTLCKVNTIDPVFDDVVARCRAFVLALGIVTTNVTLLAGDAPDVDVASGVGEADGTRGPDPPPPPQAASATTALAAIHRNRTIIGGSPP